MKASQKKLNNAKLIFRMCLLCPYSLKRLLIFLDEIKGNPAPHLKHKSFRLWNQRWIFLHSFAKLCGVSCHIQLLWCLFCLIYQNAKFLIIHPGISSFHLGNCQELTGHYLTKADIVTTKILDAHQYHEEKLPQTAVCFPPKVIFFRKDFLKF